MGQDQYGNSFCVGRRFSAAQEVMSKNVIKLQLQHMNNIIKVMAEETVARKLGYVLKEEQRKVINAFV